MISTSDTRFISWLDTLLLHLSATPFNAHIRTAVTAIKTANNTTIETNLLQGAQANLGFLTTAAGVKNHCLLYHYLEESGSPILNQQRGHYALFGFGDSAQPVTVNTAILFDVEDKHVLGLAYLQDLDTTDKINASPPTTGPNAIPRTEEVLHSTILLP
eukprot:15339619-Ditylum_brightwellii.AAC.1